jgi:hypothetical protein
MNLELTETLHIHYYQEKCRFVFRQDKLIPQTKVQSLKNIAKNEIRDKLYKENRTKLGKFKSKVEALPLPSLLKAYVLSEPIVSQQFKQDLLQAINGDRSDIYGHKLEILLDELKPDKDFDYRMIILDNVKKDIEGENSETNKKCVLKNESRFSGIGKKFTTTSNK